MRTLIISILFPLTLIAQKNESPPPFMDEYLLGGNYINDYSNWKGGFGGQVELRRQFFSGEKFEFIFGFGLSLNNQFRDTIFYNQNHYSYDIDVRMTKFYVPFQVRRNLMEGNFFIQGGFNFNLIQFSSVRGWDYQLYRYYPTCAYCTHTPPPSTLPLESLPINGSFVDFSFAAGGLLKSFQKYSLYVNLAYVYYHKPKDNSRFFTYKENNFRVSLVWSKNN